MAERTPLYLDFYNGEVTEIPDGDSLPASSYQFPIGYVLINTTNTDPFDDLGYGAWTARGSASQGGTTIYYWQRSE